MEMQNLRQRFAKDKNFRQIAMIEELVQRPCGKLDRLGAGSQIVPCI